MSEQHHPRHEQQQAPSEAPRQPEHAPESEKTSSPEKHHDHAAQNLEHVRHQVEHTAVSGQEVRLPHHDGDSSHTPLGLQQELKNTAYNRTISRVRQRLSAPEKSFSKIVHQPTVDRWSELAGKTVARPSGFLGGDLVVLAGSVVLLYTSKHYGFTYNYLAFLLLLIAGFGLGLVAELLLRLAFRKR